MGQVIDLVGGPGGAQHLIEDHAIHRYHGVVPGDDFLGRHVEHRFHHVHLGADLIEHGDDDVQPRIQGLGVPAEPFHRVVVALGNPAHAHEHQNQGENEQRNNYG